MIKTNTITHLLDKESDWLVTNILSFFITWERVGEAAMSIVTSLIIAVLTYYVREFLKSLKKKKDQ